MAHQLGFLFQLFYPVVVRLDSPFPLVDLFLVVGFVGIQKRVLEETEHFLQFLVHFADAAVHEALQLLEVLLGNHDRSCHFFMHLANDEHELLNLKLLALNLAVFELDLGVGYVQVGLQLLELRHAYYVLAKLLYFKLQPLVLDGLLAELVAQLLYFSLVSLNLLFLGLNFGFLLRFSLLKCVYLH